MCMPALSTGVLRRGQVQSCTPVVVIVVVVVVNAVVVVVIAVVVVVVVVVAVSVIYTWLFRCC